MVVSARWGSAYSVISPYAKWLGNLATVASLASNVMQMAPQFEKVYKSNSSGISKAQQLSLLTSIVAQKTLAGVITGVGTADALVQSTANYLTNPVNQQRVLLNLVTVRIF